MGSYHPPDDHSGTPSPYYSRLTSRFTPEDDLFLVSWLARHNGDGLGRRGTKIYQKLVQQHPTGTNIKVNRWRYRYVENANHFDPLIRQYIIDNLGSETAGSPTYIPPEIRPFTDEDEKHLIDYLARHPANRKAGGLLGRKMYQRLTDNVEGQSPWGAKHSWYEWRNYYYTNSEKLDKLIEQYRSVNNIIFERVKKVPRSALLKGLPTEEDYLLSEFIAEMKVKGFKASSRLIYRVLIEDEEKKWPWSKRCAAETWRSRYYQKRELMDFLIQEKLAEIAHESGAGIAASISESQKIAGRRRKSTQLDNANSFDLSEGSGPDIDGEPLVSIAGSSMMKQETGTLAEKQSPSQVPSSPFTSLVFAKAESESGGTSWRRESTSGISFSRYSEPRPETSDPLSEAVTTAVSQLPPYGLFTRQDDLVLLKYMMERSLDEKPGKKKRIGDLFKGIEFFQELTKTIPAAGRHTAQTWRTRYLKNKMQFDRLVNQMKGPVERARRQSLSQTNISVPNSPQRIKRQIGDGDISEEGGHTKKIKNSDKAKSNGARGKRIENQESSDRVKLMDIHDEADTEEEGEVANYLCDLVDF